jgi:hypothetical protein
MRDQEELRLGYTRVGELYRRMALLRRRLRQGVRHARYCLRTAVEVLQLVSSLAHEWMQMQRKLASEQ